MRRSGTPRDSPGLPGTRRDAAGRPWTWIIREGGATLDIGEAVEKRTIWLD